MTATLVERSAIRYTPAGVPVVEAQLQHQSQVEEAGGSRTLDFAFGAIALGPVARRLAAESLGSAVEVTGFVAPRSRRSTRLLVHVQDFSRQQAAPGTAVLRKSVNS